MLTVLARRGNMFILEETIILVKRYKKKYKKGWKTNILEIYNIFVK